jgi:hypothetical protein
LVKSDDQQAAEQQQRACKPHEQIAFKEIGREHANLERAQRDDAGDDCQPRPQDARERAGPGL